MDEGDQIVISGIAGRFPQCENVDQFKDALLSGVDLVKEDDRRYPAGIYGTPKRMGCIPTIDKFDASFFGIHPKQASYMDPRHRILLETVYEAIVDAGYNPNELRGSRTGVYVGMTTFNNNEVFRKQDTDGYSNIGLSLALAANRASYCFDFKGPSYSLDTACSSSMICFVNALNDIKAGIIDSAMVCGTHILYHPHETLEFDRLNMLSPTGSCLVFSTERNGYCRSETVVTYFLQRRRESRRIYATVIGGKTNTDGFKKEGITYPSSVEQFNLMKELYESVNVDPNRIDYLEAHGTGTPVGDIQECLAIAKQFCTGREQPLPVGAVKSNMGHSEMSSGLCSLTKVIVASETGIIPANLYVDKLDKTLPGICDNKLQVVTENTKWEGGVVGVNSFGFGGTNAHLILQTHSKEKTKLTQRPKHRLVQVSGRTEEAVLHFLDEVNENQDDRDFLALVDEIHKSNIDGHNYRGYTVLGERPQREIARVSTKRPLWFIYSGMGSQWTRMGRDLMKIEVFRNTMNRCADALKPYNVDLIDIITSEDPKVFDSIMNCFCAIGCTEIALTDVLYSLGIYPDGIAGHSLGEVGCSYADGQITPEQAALLVYSRGYGSQNTVIPPGQMAAVGLSKEKLKEILPDDIYIACQNSKDSITISGPQASTKAFVEKLSSQGVFARLVKSADIAFHTKYVAEAGDLLLEFCKKVLTDPKPRSSKWISSSVPPSKRDQPWTQYNCAEYHHNNFCNPVLFDQVYEHIPDNAIVIEVAPHGLLQAILKREMGPDTTHISLANRASEDNEQYFLAAIGKIFLAGGQPNLRNMYKEVSFPVARGTKMVGPLVKWDHSVSWFTPLFENEDYFGSTISVSLSDQKYSYLEGHEIDGRILMPATGYLDLVWQLVASKHLKDIQEFPVVLQDIKFKRATILSYTDSVTFLVNVMKQSGYFEIFESGSIVCSGVIRSVKDISTEFVLKELPDAPKNGSALMQRNDVYKECHLRKYMYKDYFQGIIECDVQGLNGVVEWKGKYGSFLDTMLHLTVISDSARDIMLPTSILKIVIDPVEHTNAVNKNEALPIAFNPALNVIKSGGIEIIGLNSSKAPRRQNVQSPPSLETHEFISYKTSQEDLDTSLRTALQIILQNQRGLQKEMTICEITTGKINENLNQTIKNILDNQPLTDVAFSSADADQISGKYDAIVLNEKILNSVNVSSIAEKLNENGFVLYKGSRGELGDTGFQTVFEATATTDEDSVYLLRPEAEIPDNHALIHVRNTDFEWLEDLKTLSTHNESRVVYLISQDEDTTGIMGLMKCLLAEPTNLKFRSIFIDQKFDEFSVDNQFYRDQLKRDLTFNVLRQDTWGTYVFLPLKEIEKKDVGNAAVTITTPGDLSTVTWIERPFEGIRFFDDSEQIYVYYSALNFKDVMLATGKLSLRSITDIPTAPEVNMGLEYSGVTAKGRRVMGIMGCECLSLQVLNDPYFTWEVPKDWTLRDAATVPCVYATCYYGLIVKGQLQPGESILIHAGTGGIGIAAINIALSIGCDVFTTVGSTEKREYLKQMFPQLEDKNIGNSRDASFETLIKINTKGRGVDVVLNSLADTLFQASMRCVAPGGRFLEIGKVDLTNSSPIPSSMFLKNISFHGIHIDGFFGPQCTAKKQIQTLVAEGIARGVVKPLPSIVFDENQVESALRYLASGKHKGKVLIEMRKEDLIPLNSPIRSISAVQSLHFDPMKSYVLVGGLGGFGLELTDWLIRKGATKIILNSRNGVVNGYQAYCLRKWSQYKDVIVKTDTSDTSTVGGAEELINSANRLGPVGGIFNMALILRDAILTNQTRENYQETFKTKIISGQNMDAVSRRLCNELDHFVAFSSIASGRGNIGQTNYGMANSALERLCEKRKRHNLPGLAVQWGPVGEVGVLIKLGAEEKAFYNLQPQKIASCLNALEKFMLQPCAVGSSVVLVDERDEAAAQVTRTPAESVAHILGITNLDLVDKALTLSQLGLDSLMATEIKQTLYRNYQLELNPEEIRDLTLNTLIAMGDTESEESASEVNSVTRESTNYLLAEEVVVKMNSISNSGKNIFVIHPIEGQVDILKPVARKLKAAVYGLQATDETKAEKMDDLARYYIGKIREIQPKGPYLLCGYSYGGSLGIEISLQLEKDGESVDLVTIDSSPIFVQNILRNATMRLNNSIEKSQETILATFASSFSTVDQSEVAKALETSKIWEIQAESVCKLISKATGVDSAKVSASFQSFHRRVSASYYYEPSTAFKGRILLIRRNENPFFLSDNYELQKFCKQPVGIVKLQGDHTTILLGDNSQIVADVINRFFDV